ncbi:hypothetical protein M2480_000384 [Parabacteroides sp. PFB2-12]|uniref:DUF3244 domain-containing protein n=1 Tax=unclassified Parabacteroides TaxID=2649774 RepID=UPI0024736114|nr:MULTISPECIES: DUF3244 domain-containing protein [unclassified Parabacteroides]MDH6341234.1 hypothetical protein [Parabacteroides sp. PM6-13]MDH6389424.1 hypothetical protein [Parabacteroides sp. PFB2-12]
MNTHNTYKVIIGIILCLLPVMDIIAKKSIILEEIKRNRQGKSLNIGQVQGYLDDNTLVIEFPQTYGIVHISITHENSNQVVYQDDYLIVEPDLSLSIHLLNQVSEGRYFIQISTEISKISGYFEIE